MYATFLNLKNRYDLSANQSNWIPNSVIKSLFIFYHMFAI